MDKTFVRDDGRHPLRLFKVPAFPLFLKYRSSGWAVGHGLDSGLERLETSLLHNSHTFIVADPANVQSVDTRAKRIKEGERYEQCRLDPANCLFRHVLDPELSVRDRRPRSTHGMIAESSHG